MNDKQQTQQPTMGKTKALTSNGTCLHDGWTTTSIKSNKSKAMETVFRSTMVNRFHFPVCRSHQTIQTDDENKERIN